MFSNARYLIVVLLTMALALSSCGCCTLIGGCIGAATDAEKPHGPVPPEQWTRLNPGQEVEITRLDGTKSPMVPGPDSTLGSVPAGEISRVEVPQSHKGLRKGAVIGAAFDVAIAVVYIIAAVTYDPY